MEGEDEWKGRMSERGGRVEGEDEWKGRMSGRGG